MSTATPALIMIVLLGLLALIAGPASAQGEGMERLARPSDHTSQGNDDTLYRGSYAVTEDGALVYGGDAVYQCGDLVKLGAPAKPGSTGAPGSTINGSVVEPLTREAVELCAEAGFPPDGASFSASTDADSAETGESAVLPETGSTALPALVLGAAAFAVAVVLAIVLVARSVKR